jgi:hypothetical protein
VFFVRSMEVPVRLRGVLVDIKNFQLLITGRLIGTHNGTQLPVLELSFASV